ncbi:hypothetical protein VNO77_23370 [Canavalia gladiata]|uniref:Uncharacterized protein n=1 Tax=Canavalia gladiata TaxID=3824 RepID=A0AAN9L4T9_CANGL
MRKKQRQNKILQDSQRRVLLLVTLVGGRPNIAQESYPCTWPSQSCTCEQFHEREGDQGFFLIFGENHFEIVSRSFLVLSLVTRNSSRKHKKRRISPVALVLLQEDLHADRKSEESFVDLGTVFELTYTILVLDSSR